MAVGEDYLEEIRAQLKQGRNQWKRGDKLLEAFGYTRRRQTAVDLINGVLASKNMYTTPGVTTEMPLDRAIRFHLKGTEPQAAEPAEVEHESGTPVEKVEIAEQDALEGEELKQVALPQEPPVVEPSRGLIVGNLACAERPPVQISPTDPLERALTRMAVYDYSQLVVSTGSRSVKGVISYKSIAQAYLQGSPKIVGDCIDTSLPQVELNEPLLNVVKRFQNHDAVLVLKRDRTLSGIVTPADIAAEFGAMAAPFFLIGQIEDQLRWLVQKSFGELSRPLSNVGLASSVGPPPSISDLTMGDLHRVLDNEQNWAHLGIKFDRSEFCKELDAIRDIRNAVMHFRDLPSGASDRLNRFATVVQTAYRRLARSDVSTA